MNVRNCRRCGRLFNYVSGPPICPKCKEEIEAKFHEVKNYIRDHVKASIAEVAQECEVDASQIHQWIREERLEFTADSPIRISCEKCGALIQTGRFCEKCKADMAHELGNTYEKPAPPPQREVRDKKDKAKMRFLDRDGE